MAATGTDRDARKNGFLSSFFSFMFGKKSSRLSEQDLQLEAKGYSKVRKTFDIHYLYIENVLLVVQSSFVQLRRCGVGERRGSRTKRKRREREREREGEEEEEKRGEEEEKRGGGGEEDEVSSFF